MFERASVNAICIFIARRLRYLYLDGDINTRIVPCIKHYRCLSFFLLVTMNLSRFIVSTTLVATVLFVLLGCNVSGADDMDPISSSITKGRRKLKHVTVNYDGSQVWGVSKWGQMWYCMPSRRWRKVSAKSNQIAVSGDGNHLWDVSKKKKNWRVYYSTIDAALEGIFVRIKGIGMKYISVSHDGSHVWAVNKKHKVYYRNGVGGVWQWMKGRYLKVVSVSGDGNHVWGVTGKNVVYYRKGIDGRYTKIPGEMKHVSVSYDGSHVWAVDKDDEAYYRSGDDWMKLPSFKVKQVSLSGDGYHVWGVDADYNTYYYNNEPSTDLSYTPFKTHDELANAANIYCEDPSGWNKTSLFIRYG